MSGTPDWALEPENNKNKYILARFIKHYNKKKFKKSINSEFVKWEFWTVSNLKTNFGFYVKKVKYLTIRSGI